MNVGQILGCAPCCLKAARTKEAVIARWENPDFSDRDQGKADPLAPAEASPDPSLHDCFTPRASRIGFFTARLEKQTSATWALDLNFGRLKRLCVIKVKDGPIARYNKANPDKMIEDGDWIEKVDEIVNAPQAMVQALLKQDRMELVVRKSWYTGQINWETMEKAEHSEREGAGICDQSWLNFQPLQQEWAAKPDSEHVVVRMAKLKSLGNIKTRSATAPGQVERQESLADSESTGLGPSESSILFPRTRASSESGQNLLHSETSGSQVFAREPRIHDVMSSSKVSSQETSPEEKYQSAPEEKYREISFACEDLFHEERDAWSTTWEGLATVPESVSNDKALGPDSEPKEYTVEDWYPEDKSALSRLWEKLSSVPEPASNSSTKDHPHSVPESASSSSSNSNNTSTHSIRCEGNTPLPETAASHKKVHMGLLQSTEDNAQVTHLPSVRDSAVLTPRHNTDSPCLTPRQLARRDSWENAGGKSPRMMERRASYSGAEQAPNEALEQRLSDCLALVTFFEEQYARRDVFKLPEDFRPRVLKLSQELEIVGNEALEDGCSREVPGAMEIFEQRNQALDRLATLLATEELAVPALIEQKIPVLKAPGSRGRSTCTCTGCFSGVMH
mmetsp:Transcript_36551/g.68021  ORF Transcript_36551/g.68021 Transcript_36551/m.68021 type:complete len:621 (-) Transcript_36551:26-1888(-)